MPLSVGAELSVMTPAGEVSLVGRGSGLRLRMSSVRAARHVVRILAADRARRDRLLALLERGLRRAQLDLHVEIGGRLVASMGPAVAPNGLARLLGWSPARLHLLQLLAALVTGPGQLEPSR